MIRIILFAWFLLVAVVLISTDLYDVKQFNSTRFAQIETDSQTQHSVRHHS